MKIILTGGGTGGHIHTSLAIGEKFKEKDPNCEILYIGTSLGNEKNMLANTGFRSQYIELGWFDRNNLITIFSALHGLYKGIRQVRRIIRDFKPDFIFSSGAFAGVPAIIVALSEKTPFYLHDQNCIPGKANLFFSRKSRIMFIGVEDARKYYKKDVNVLYCGNPVMKAFYDRNRAIDRETLGFSQDDMVITVFSGSNGAAVINNIGFELIKEFGNKPGYRIIFITGRKSYDKVCGELDKQGISGFDNISVYPNIDNMPEVMSSSSILICSPGISRSEISVVGRAAILVPLNEAAGNHQYYNAKEIADKGGAVIIVENEETPEIVMKEIQRLDKDRSLISEMEKASHRLAPLDAPDIIYNAIMNTYRNHS